MKKDFTTDLMDFIANSSVSNEEATQAICFAYGYLVEGMLAEMAKMNSGAVPPIQIKINRMVDKGLEMAKFAQNLVAVDNGLLTKN